MQVTLIDFTLSRLQTIDGGGAYCDLDADPELFQGPKGDCQVGWLSSQHIRKIPCSFLLGEDTCIRSTP